MTHQIEMRIIKIRLLKMRETSKQIIIISLMGKLALNLVSNISVDKCSQHA